MARGPRKIDNLTAADIAQLSPAAQKQIKAQLEAAKTQIAAADSIENVAETLKKEEEIRAKREEILTKKLERTVDNLEKTTENQKKKSEEEETQPSKQQSPFKEKALEFGAGTFDRMFPSLGKFIDFIAKDLDKKSDNKEQEGRRETESINASMESVSDRQEVTNERLTDLLTEQKKTNKILEKIAASGINGSGGGGGGGGDNGGSWFDWFKKSGKGAGAAEGAAAAEGTAAAEGATVAEGATAAVGTGVLGGMALAGGIGLATGGAAVYALDSLHKKEEELAKQGNYAELEKMVRQDAEMNAYDPGTGMPISGFDVDAVTQNDMEGWISKYPQLLKNKKDAEPVSKESATIPTQTIAASEVSYDKMRGLQNAKTAEFDPNTGKQLSQKEIEKKNADAQGTPIVDAMGSFTGMYEAPQEGPSLDQQQAQRNNLDDKGDFRNKGKGRIESGARQRLKAGKYSNSFEKEIDQELATSEENSIKQLDMIDDFAMRMGIKGDKHSAQLIGNVPVTIDGKPVPENLYTDEQKESIKVARETGEEMAKAAAVTSAGIAKQQSGGDAAPVAKEPAATPDATNAAPVSKEPVQTDIHQQLDNASEARLMAKVDKIKQAAGVTGPGSASGTLVGGQVVSAAPVMSSTPGVSESVAALQQQSTAAEQAKQEQQLDSITQNAREINFTADNITFNGNVSFGQPSAAQVRSAAPLGPAAPAAPAIPAAPAAPAAPPPAPFDIRREEAGKGARAAGGPLAPAAAVEGAAPSPTSTGRGARAAGGPLAPAEKVTGLGGGTFKQQAPEVMDKLMKDFNLSKEQAAGIVGNLGHESAGLQAGIQEKNPIAGKGGLGWAQWTGPRRRAFEAYLKETGQEATDPNANYGFLKKELETTHKGSIDAVKKTSDVQGAMMAFEQKYEAAGVKSYGSREKYAEQASKLYEEKQTAALQEKQKTQTSAVLNEKETSTLSGAKMALESTKDAMDQRSSRQAITVNQNMSGDKSPGSPDKQGNGTMDQSNVGSVEPADARQRFAELFGIGSGHA